MKVVLLTLRMVTDGGANGYTGRANPASHLRYLVPRVNRVGHDELVVDAQDGDARNAAVSQVGGWALTEADVTAHRDDARALVGQRLAAVRYVNIDYVGMTRPEFEGRGPRLIEADQEWQQPSWDFGSFHSVDYGVELHTSQQRVFAISWEPPGQTESLWVDERPLIGSGVSTDAHVAVWDVSSRTRWCEFLDEPTTDVGLHYLAWSPDEPGFWCPRITLWIGDSNIELLLGEARGHGELVPAADNVAVLFSPAALPEWEESAS